jgi:hypothetical protein
MSTRADDGSSTSSRADLDPNSEQSHSRDDRVSSTVDAVGSITADAVDLMVRMPLQITAAGLGWMTSGLQQLTQGSSSSAASSGSLAAGSPSPGAGPQAGSRSTWGTTGDQNSESTWSNRDTAAGSGSGSGTGSSSSSSSQSRAGDDQGLGGPDVKFVLWSVVFTKPGYEAALVPLQTDLVSYPTDATTFCAMKIAKVVEKARDGRLEKPAVWVEHSYPGEFSASTSRQESTAAAGATKTETAGQPTEKDKGWRIPSDDSRYLHCVYRVEFRLPKEEVDVTTRVERVIVERTR